MSVKCVNTNAKLPVAVSIGFVDLRAQRYVSQTLKKWLNMRSISDSSRRVWKCQGFTAEPDELENPFQTILVVFLRVDFGKPRSFAQLLCTSLPMCASCEQMKTSCGTRASFCRLQLGFSVLTWVYIQEFGSAYHDEMRLKDYQRSLFDSTNFEFMLLRWSNIFTHWDATRRAYAFFIIYAQASVIELLGIPAALFWKDLAQKSLFNRTRVTLQNKPAYRMASTSTERANWSARVLASLSLVW